MKYLNENGCDCRQYFENGKFPRSLHEHDFAHAQKDTVDLESKHKRARDNADYAAERGAFVQVHKDALK